MSQAENKTYINIFKKLIIYQLWWILFILINFKVSSLYV